MEVIGVTDRQTEARNTFQQYLKELKRNSGDCKFNK